MHVDTTILWAAGDRHGMLGSYFVDLASNMLGSFVMGVLTASSAFDKPTPKSIAVLPENHVWQVRPPKPNASFPNQAIPHLTTVHTTRPLHAGVPNVLRNVEVKAMSVHTAGPIWTNTNCTFSLKRFIILPRVPYPIMPLLASRV
jgi:hypothetical protein